MLVNTVHDPLSLLSPATRATNAIEDSITQNGITGFLRFERALSTFPHSATGTDTFDAWEDMLCVASECLLSDTPFVSDHLRPALAFPDISISALPGIEMIGPWRTAPPPHLFVIAQAHPLWQTCFTIAWRCNFESSDDRERALFQALRKCGSYNPKLMKHVFFRAYVVHVHEGHPSSGEVLRLSEDQNRMAYTTLIARSNELDLADDEYFYWAKFGRFRRQTMDDIIKYYRNLHFFPVGIFVENYPVRYLSSFQTLSTAIFSQRAYVNIGEIIQTI